MEWAFAGPATVQKDINDIILKALEDLKPGTTYKDIRGQSIPIVRAIGSEKQQQPSPEAHSFTNLTFAECISLYGIDKPDLRIPNKVRQI